MAANTFGYNMGNNMNVPYNNNLLMNTPYNNYMGGNSQMMQMSGMQQYLRCRPVSSKQEAMAFQIDLDGSLWVFINAAKGKIYTKQINNDGTASFNTYVLTEQKQEMPPNYQQYVTREEFNKALESLMAVLPNNSSTQTNTTQF